MVATPAEVAAEEAEAAEAEVAPAEAEAAATRIPAKKRKSEFFPFCPLTRRTRCVGSRRRAPATLQLAANQGRSLQGWETFQLDCE